MANSITPAFAAKMILHEHKNYTHPLDMLDFLLDFENISVIPDNRLKKDALILRKPESKKAIIVINPSLLKKPSAYGRLNFTLAHELGHYVLHKDILTIICSIPDFSHFKPDKIREWEANEFASELLTPAEHLKKYLNGDISINTIRKISEAFLTSITSSAIKIVDNAPCKCAVVHTINGQIIWTRKSKGMHKYEFVNKLNEHSYIFDFYNGVKGDYENAEPVYPFAWFTNELPDDLDIREESITFSCSGNYAALTLIKINETDEDLENDYSIYL